MLKYPGFNYQNIIVEKQPFYKPVCVGFGFGDSLGQRPEAELLRVCVSHHVFEDVSVLSKLQ